MPYIFLLLVTLPLVVSADQWSKNYEKPVCNSNDSPDGDVTLVCSESNTVKNLKVLVSNANLSDSNYSATVNITNTNKYPVKIKTVIVDAKDNTGQVSGFCSNSVSQLLLPTQNFETNINCSFSGTGPDSVQSVKIRATPWG